MIRPRRISCFIAVAGVLIVVAALCAWVTHQFHLQTLNRALIAAIKDSDVAAVNSLLADGADPNTRDLPEKQETLIQKLKHLIHPQRNLEPTAVFVALEQDRGDEHLLPAETPAIVRALVDRGANVKSPDKFGDLPVAVLFTEENSGAIPQTLEILLNAGANPNPKPRYADQPPPLLTSVVNKDTACVSMLLEHGANPDASGLDEITPLAAAYIENRSDLARMLLEHGANPNPEQSPEGTPLHAAQMYSNTEIVKLLKLHGAKR